MHKIFKKKFTYLTIKRVFDIIFSILLIIGLFPLFIIVSLLVKVSSPGPIFFRQVRVGMNKKPFKILKFRTMKIEISVNNKPLKDRERTTFIGTFLRKLSLDELPQFINVLIGEMSIIGPRPILFNDLPSLNKDEEIRFFLRPGISSFAGVNGRNSLLRKEKYQMEMHYAKNISFKMDFIIFFKTIWVVLKASNIEDKVNEERIASEIIEEN